MKFSDSVHKPKMHGNIKCWARKPCKNYLIHISASLSRQPLVKGERSVRNEVNAVMASVEFRFGMAITKSGHSMKYHSIVKDNSKV